jgi:hypothetical protein
MQVIPSLFISYHAAMTSIAASPRRRCAAAGSDAGRQRFLRHLARGTQASAVPDASRYTCTCFTAPPRAFRLLSKALVAAAWCERPSDAASSVHFDVLKSSTLEMIPTETYHSLLPETLRPFPPSCSLPSRLPSHGLPQLRPALRRLHRATRVPVQGPRQIRSRDWRSRLRLSLPLQLPRLQRQ